MKGDLNETVESLENLCEWITLYFILNVLLLLPSVAATIYKPSTNHLHRHLHNLGSLDPWLNFKFVSLHILRISLPLPLSLCRLLKFWERNPLSSPRTRRIQMFVRRVPAWSVEDVFETLKFRVIPDTRKEKSCSSPVIWFSQADHLDSVSIMKNVFKDVIFASDHCKFYFVDTQS